MSRISNPDLVDQDAPEATAEWFAKAQHAKDLLPGLMGEFAAQEMLKPRRGRPPLVAPNEHVNIRLDAGVPVSERHGSDPSLPAAHFAALMRNGIHLRAGILVLAINK